MGSLDFPTITKVSLVEHHLCKIIICSFSLITVNKTLLLTILYIK